MRMFLAQLVVGAAVCYLLYVMLPVFAPLINVPSLLIGGSLAFVVRRSWILGGLIERERGADHAGVDRKHDARY